MKNSNAAPGMQGTKPAQTEPAGQVQDSSGTVSELIKLKPDIIRIEEKDKLSKRKARKLAWLYRGSSRGKRYKDFLAGENRWAFYSHNRRLYRFPTFGKTTIVTVHSVGVTTALEGLLAKQKPYSIEAPAERVLRIEDTPEIGIRKP